MPNARRSTRSIPDNIAFSAMTKNLRDDASFHVWIQRLWEWDWVLTVKYMRRHRDEFGPEAIETFNRMLRVHRRDRYAL